MTWCSAGGVYAGFAKRVNHESNKSELVNRKSDKRRLTPGTAVDKTVLKGLIFENSRQGLEKLITRVRFT
jgi:hypothetical protein